MSEERGTLEPTEWHPAADSALRFIKSHGIQELSMLLESYSSCAIEGNRLAEVCAETLDRAMSGKPVSDRYLLGLAWNMKEMSDARVQKQK